MAARIVRTATGGRYGAGSRVCGKFTEFSGDFAVCENVLKSSVTRNYQFFSSPLPPWDSMIDFFLNFFLNLDTELAKFVELYGVWVYALLFLIVFAETGLVVTPFLPGDSLLFTTGALAAVNVLDVWLVVPLLLVAAILGDAVNYAVGHFVGPRVFRAEGDASFWQRLLNRLRPQQVRRPRPQRQGRDAAGHAVEMKLFEPRAHGGGGGRQCSPYEVTSVLGQAAGLIFITWQRAYERGGNGHGSSRRQGGTSGGHRGRLLHYVLGDGRKVAGHAEAAAPTRALWPRELRRAMLRPRANIPEQISQNKHHRRAHQELKGQRSWPADTLPASF